VSEPSRPFKALSVIIALSVLGLALAVTGAQALFGTKVAPLFGMSPEALAGAAEASSKRVERADGGSARRPRASPLGASKSGAVFHERDFDSEPSTDPVLGAPDAGPQPRLAPLGASKAFGPFQARDFDSRLGGLRGDTLVDGGGGQGIGGLGSAKDAGAR
jgi:hypothetical protein